MTEQQALKYLKDANRNNQMVGILPKSDIGKCLVNALEEVQQYRAIGTPEELKQLKENGSFTGMELAQIAIGQMKLKEYMAIGTPEKCRAAVEKQKERKPIKYDKKALWAYACPKCGEPLIKTNYEYKYCDMCGQKLDWGDENDD